jgi:hypothetical protein
MLGLPHGEASIPTVDRHAPNHRGSAPAARRYNRGPMFKSLVRTIRGPSNDPRMAYISRPLPGGLLDEQVVEALARALAANPDPAYLVETLPAALREVTGRTYQVLDRSVYDVTGAFSKTMVMIRDGSVGLWPGYAARAYPMLAPAGTAEETRRAIVAAEGDGTPAEPSPTSPVGKPGWAPPPVARRPGAVEPMADAGVGPESGVEHG